MPEDRRTPDRDQAAREILEWMRDPDVNWPLSGRDMAERGEYSPQHYRHTQSLYQLTENDNGGKGGGREVTIRIPHDVDVEAYARGYLDGYLEGREKGGE